MGIGISVETLGKLLDQALEEKSKFVSFDPGDGHDDYYFRMYLWDEKIHGFSTAKPIYEVKNKAGGFEKQCIKRIVKVNDQVTEI